MKKILWLTLGCISLGFGAVGTMLPMLPTVPFLLLTAVSFAKSSERLHTWFMGTKLYKDHMEDYVAGRGMTRKTKIHIIITVTLLMGIGFVMMAVKEIVVGCIVLGCVWILHIIYFFLV